MIELRKLPQHPGLQPWLGVPLCSEETLALPLDTQRGF